MRLSFSNTPIGRLRLIGFCEGVSYLFLLGIAMPLKYYAQLPDAVKYTGWMHGLLFILYILALINVRLVVHTSLKLLITAFVASLIPFGTFLIDARLQKEEQLSLS